VTNFIYYIVKEKTMPRRPNPFKMCCTNCGYEKVVHFSSDCLDADDMAQIPKVCPKCGNDKFERKPYTDTGYSMFDLIKRIFK
jgi:hypothetical protein